MRTYHAESARTALDSLARAGLGREDFSREVIDVIGRAVPYDSICFATTDPATGLFTATTKKALDEDDALNYAFAMHEYSSVDVNQFIDLALRPVAVGILSEDTAGDPQRSDRYLDMLRPHLDAEHEMRAVARAGGSMWGAYALYRAPGSSGFSPAEADFLHGVEGIIAAGIRTSLVASAVEAAEEQFAPAVLMFDHAGRIAQVTPSAEQRLVDLGGGAADGVLPIAVASVVSAARLHLGRPEWVLPRLRVRGASGHWYILHASPFQSIDGTGTHIVVTIEQAGPPEIIPLLVAAYALTPRESEVLRGVLKGESTKEIAATLFLSPYTVQDHLKVIFDKTGSSSRRELISQIFFSHQAQRHGELTSPSGGNVAAAPPLGPRASSMHVPIASAG